MPWWSGKIDCAKCGAKPEKPLRCAACKAFYCSRTCQREHWPTHKPLCQSTVASKETIKDMKPTEGASLTPTELIDELRKWVISHRKIMHWAVAQGTQAFVFPKRMKDHIVEIEVEHVGSRRKPHHFALKTLNVAPVESTETGPRDETWLARGRLDAEELIADGGAGVLMFYVLCNGLIFTQMSKIGKNQLPHPFDNRIVCSNYKETFRKVLAGKLDGQLVTACWSACEVQDMPDVGGPEGDQDKYAVVHLEPEKRAVKWFVCSKATGKPVSTTLYSSRDQFKQLVAEELAYRLKQ